MSSLGHYGAYAAAFERAYASDDWSEVEAFFTDSAVYEVGLPMLGAERCSGRTAIVAWFRHLLDRFDRKFESRKLSLLQGPVVRDDEVWTQGTATYRAEGVPDLVLELEETVRFDGRQIVHLEDRYTAKMLAELMEYLQVHGGKLGITRELLEP